METPHPLGAAFGFVASSSLLLRWNFHHHKRQAHVAHSACDFPTAFSGKDDRTGLKSDNTVPAWDLGFQCGADASNLRPSILKPPGTPRYQGHFISNEPSGLIDPGPPGQNTTVFLDQNSVHNLPFP